MLGDEVKIEKNIQTYLIDNCGLVGDNHKKAFVAIKLVTIISGFPVHIKVMFILYYSLVSVQ